MSALQQHKLFVFYLKWEGAMDRLSMILTGTIPETPISHEWSQWLERPLEVIPTAGRRLCE